MMDIIEMMDMMNMENSSIIFLTLVLFISTIFLTLFIWKKNFIYNYKQKRMSNILSNFLNRLKTLFQPRATTSNMDEKKTILLTTIPQNLTEDLLDSKNANEMKTVISNIPTNSDPMTTITDVNMDMTTPKEDYILSNNLIKPSPLRNFLSNSFLFSSPNYYSREKFKFLKDESSNPTPSSMASLSPVSMPRMNNYLTDYRFVSTKLHASSPHSHPHMHDQATQTDTLPPTPLIYYKPLSNIYGRNGIPSYLSYKNPQESISPILI